MEPKNIPYAITERYLEGRITAGAAIGRLLSVIRNTAPDDEVLKSCVSCIDRIVHNAGI